MDRITTMEVIDKLDMFPYIFEKIEKFGFWDWEIISADACTQSTSTELRNECQTGGVNLTLSAPEHQEMNG